MRFAKCANSAAHFVLLRFPSQPKPQDLNQKPSVHLSVSSRTASMCVQEMFNQRNASSNYKQTARWNVLTDSNTYQPSRRQVLCSATP